MPISYIWYDKEKYQKMPKKSVFSPGAEALERPARGHQVG